MLPPAGCLPGFRVQAGGPGVSTADATSSGLSLRERRTKLFDLTIDYVPCRQFLRADAQRLACELPEAAAIPLTIDRGAAASRPGLTPYVASLYETRLLTKEEEAFYFRRMNWLKFRAATERGGLDRRRASLRQIERIEGLLAEAVAVRSILITANLRLVVSIAKKFVDPSTLFEELVSEGNVALVRAVEKFNFALGNRFSTYATYAIQRHFFRFTQRSRTLRGRFVPDESSFDSRPAAETDAERCTPAQVDLLKGLFQGFLDDLEPRERQIVVARFGFDGLPPRTFRELGSSMGVCKERIRQIQTRALDKLRDMAAAVHLEQTVGDWV